jgi:DnaJ-class molecular chaperone
MDIFKMANQIANSMSMDDKEDLDNMDMQEMISHVTKNVLGMMNNPNGPMANFPFKPPTTNASNVNVPVNTPSKIEEQEEDSGDDETDCIFPKTRDICFELNVDLEDFYTGKKKKLNVKRKRMVIGEDGKQTIVEEKKKLIIPIEKGMKDEQQIRFEGEADQIPGYKPGDIIITLIENEHPVFQRDGDNLIMIKNINLYQSYSYTFDINHLDNNVYRVNNVPDEALHLNDSIRKLSNLGMPSYKSPGSYGDLFIRFNLVLPKTLDKLQLDNLFNIFKDDPFFLENRLGESFDKSLLLENVSETDLEELEDIYSDTSSEEDSEEEDTSSEEDSEDTSGSDSSEEIVLMKKRSLNKK